MKFLQASGLKGEVLARGRFKNPQVLARGRFKGIFVPRGRGFSTFVLVMVIMRIILNMLTGA
jgi:hypothetical protein